MASISFKVSATSIASSILEHHPDTSATSVSASSLPRYIALQDAVSFGGAGPYLVVTLIEGLPYLAFTGETKTESAAHEVLYDEADPSVLTLRAPNANFWQHHSSTRVIMADRVTEPSGPTSDPACYFKLFRNSNGNLLFQSIVDGTYGKFISLTESGLGFDFTTIPLGDTPAHDTSALDVVMGIAV